MAWTLDEHLGRDDEQAGSSTPASRPDCPGCGVPDLAGDDFCHECGHSFEHLGVSVEHGDLERGAPCPMCHGGELAQLDHGRTQCDSCGYMVRDEG